MVPMIDRLACLPPCTEVLLQLASSYKFFPSHSQSFTLYYTNLKFYCAFFALNLKNSMEMQISLFNSRFFIILFSLGPLSNQIVCFKSLVLGASLVASL